MQSSPKTAKKRPNIYLSGFMGTGKTSIGKRLAQALGYRFIDSDEEIEKRCAMSIKDIFATFGEPKFREMEREFIEGGHPDSGCVISCGGGLVCRDSMPELVRSKGVSIVLFSPPEVILERVQKNDKRPLLNQPNPLETIKSLMQQRQQFYMRSGTAIATSPEISDTVKHILRIYKHAINKKPRR